MENNSYDFILIFPIFLLFSIIVVTSVNVFIFIRKKFLFKVNCWFCNEWTKVPYIQKNSFECPSCLQYNGFTTTGDYNKVLPAQHDISLNKSLGKDEYTGLKNSISNGLCRLCNNNQKLRVFQLANFIPLQEDNYNVEIEHFQQQLDKAYRLCRQCESTVKTTIQKQNSSLGINIKKIASQGLSLMDLTKNSGTLSVEVKQIYLKHSVFYAIICLSLLNILHYLYRHELVGSILDKYLWVPLSPYLINIQKNYFKYFNRNEPLMGLQNFESVFMIWKYPIITDVLFIVELIWTKCLNVMGLLTRPLFLNPIFIQTQFWIYFVEILLQFIWLILNHPKGCKKNIFLLIMWIVVLSFEIGYLLPIHLYADVIKAVANVFNIVLMFLFRIYENITKKNISHTLKRKHIICVNKEETVTPETKFPFKKVVAKLPLAKQNKFCDVSTDILKDKYSKASTENMFNGNTDLDVSLNKLHIGTTTPKKSPFKVSYICSSPNLDRPRPVLSPAKLHVVTPNSWISGDFSRDSNKFQPNFSNTNQKVKEVSGFVHSGQYNFSTSRNSFCDDLDYNSFFSPPLFSMSPQPQTFGNHYNPYHPRYPCGLHYNSSYPNVINNEQLVYISPNYLPSRNVYEILRENFSTEIFDTSFTENGVNKQKLSNKIDNGTNLLYNQFNKKFQ